MNQLEKLLKNINESYHAHLNAAESYNALEHVKHIFLGRKGRVHELMDLLKTSSSEEKRVYGPAISEFRKTAEELLNQKLDILTKKSSEEKARKKKIL